MLSASYSLRNRTAKTIRYTKVLIAIDRSGSEENRLFESTTPIAAWQTKTVEAQIVDDLRYDFEFGFAHGCELDHIDYADGSWWEEPSPL